MLLGIDHTAWGRKRAKTLIDRTDEHQAWQALTQDLKWELFFNLDELYCFLDCEASRLQSKSEGIRYRALKKLTPKFIASVCGYSFILDALSVANIY